MSDSLFPPFMVEALRTATASRWTLLCARLFGKKTVGRDGHLQVTMHHWRGKAYMTGCRKTVRSKSTDPKSAAHHPADE